MKKKNSQLDIATHTHTHIYRQIDTFEKQTWQMMNELNE